MRKRNVMGLLKSREEFLMIDLEGFGSDSTITKENTQPTGFAKTFAFLSAGEVACILHGRKSGMFVQDRLAATPFIRIQ